MTNNPGRQELIDECLELMDQSDQYENSIELDWSDPVAIRAKKKCDATRAYYKSLLKDDILNDLEIFEYKQKLELELFRLIYQNEQLNENMNKFKEKLDSLRDELKKGLTDLDLDDFTPPSSREIN
jgi:hypothetical protein